MIFSREYEGNRKKILKEKIIKHQQKDSAEGSINTTVFHLLGIKSYLQIQQINTKSNSRQSFTFNDFQPELLVILHTCAAVLGFDGIYIFGKNHKINSANSSSQLQDLL